MEKTENLRKFIQGRKAFNHSCLARLAEWDKLDFSRWIRNKTDIVPQRIIDNLTIVLQNYGYND